MRSTRARARRIGALALGAALVLTGCWGGDDDDAAPTTVPDGPSADDPIVTVAGAGTRPDTATPLGIRLSEGDAADGIDDEVAVVDGEPLTPDEVAALLARLGDWEVPPEEDDQFVRPPVSLTPPEVAATIAVPFPAEGVAEPPGETPTGPLRVLRYQPEGEVDVAPFLSVTFDHPMVELATLDELDVAEVPVRVTPEISGRWRWIGTRTVRFELVPGEIDRLPAATTYEVEVPAGTRSVDGAELAETVAWTFSTPPPTVTSFVGESASLPLEPVFVATFDQRVDPIAVVDTVTVAADGADVAVRLATDAEIAADPDARQAVDAALSSRAVAFRPVDPLPPESAVTITIGPGTPSAEGPRVSEDAATYTAATFGALRVRRTECDLGDGCTPATPFRIELSNPLDPDAFSGDQITVEPAIPGLHIDVVGADIVLTGATDGRTTYTVSLAADLLDVFGQRLGDDVAIDFEVGAAPPQMIGPTRQWLTLDPMAAEPLLSVRSINHDEVRVRAWAVTPPDLPDFRDYVDGLWSDEDAEAPDWTVVLDEVVGIEDEPDRWVETPIDLSAAFVDAGSQIVVRVEPPDPPGPRDDDYWRNRPSIAWVQSTTLGLDAVVDTDQMVIWTTDLTTGEPVGGVPVELIGDGRVATTDDEGIAELDLGEDGVIGLWANAGDRTAFLPSSWWDGWQAADDRDDARWYVFDDRGVYRPGETVRIAGWVRRFAWTEGAQLALFEDDLDLLYQAFDPQGSEIASGVVGLDPLGGFDLAIELPAGSNLGPAWVELRLAGDAIGETLATTHSFSVQEFRTPAFEVSTRTVTPAPLVVGAPANVAVDAEYFAGGPLPDADVDWLVTSRTTTYRPPGHPDHVFGIWEPWWSVDGGLDDSVDVADAVAPSDECVGCDATYEQFAGRTGPDGTHVLRIDFDADGVDLPSSVTAEATVFDVDRQAWASRTALLVHPSDRYVGLRSDRPFVERGTPLRIDAIVTDIDGELVAGTPVAMTAGRVEWTFEGGRWIEDLVDAQTCEIDAIADDGAAANRCEFDTEVGGTYRITAIATDATGRANRTELTQWVSGGGVPTSRDVELERVTIVPDRETYEAGQNAELLVQAPFAPASGLVTVTRHGVVTTEGFEAEDGSAVIEVPILDEYTPNVNVQVDMVGTAVRQDDRGEVDEDAPRRPAYARGQITLSVPPASRALDVTATPAARSLEPGGETTVDIVVTDADGAPVPGAGVAVVIADEAVLALTGYELADPLDVFYRPIGDATSTTATRSSIELTRSDLAAGLDAGDGADAADDAGAGDAAEESGGADEDMADGRAEVGSIDARTDFSPLALFSPREVTGPDGSLTIPVSLPDNLTRYRVMAVAVDGADRFGEGESSITARLPLQVSTSAPRFANFGDEFDLPVVLRNQSENDVEVDVAIEVANLRLQGDAGKRVVVPSGDRVEVRFPVATDVAGTARARLIATGGGQVDASEIAFPVYTPATAEAFATYGVIDDGAIAQPIVAPTDVYPLFGGLEVDTSSTALQALTDAMLYLHDYRYDSADGYASRIMAIASLTDVLGAFGADGLPSPDELDAQVADDIRALAALQNDDGGFPAWQRGRRSIPWVSIQSTHALVLARQGGYTVPDTVLAGALAHLADIDQYIDAEYSEELRDTLRAYAIYVRGEAGEPDPGAATTLYRRAGDELGVDALAFIWPSIIDGELRAEIEQTITNRAVETPGAVTFATDYGEDAYLIAHSDVRTDGIVLDALLTQTPESDLVPKAVAGLLGNRVRGRWSNAHENAFALVALHRYFSTFEATTPDFVARAWLGDLYAAEATFQGRTTEHVTTLIPMTEVQAAGDTDLVLSKEGEGRLYYRLGLRYAPSDLRLGARDEGFAVVRDYEAVGDPDDVTQDADGTWRIRAGATVRVRVSMIADARRTNVALLDPLPAGLEPVNPDLAVSTTTPPPDQGDDPAADAAVEPDLPWSWYQHANLRDDRAEAFAGDLPGGAYEYTYIARATIPGTFVVPPARAEEIYAPEVFGRSGSATVIVE